jgi:hypothetical protein
LAANERTIPMPGYDHKGICRHGSAGGNGLKLILFQNKDILRRDAVENMSGQLIMSHSRDDYWVRFSKRFVWSIQEEPRIREID